VERKSKQGILGNLREEGSNIWRVEEGRKEESARDAEKEEGNYKEVDWKRKEG
jgi:hypothetical protein